MHINLPLLLNLSCAAAALAALALLRHRHIGFGLRVGAGLILGALFGASLQAVYGSGAPVLAETGAWLDVVGSGYVKLLQMVVMPLILVSILAAVVRLKDAAAFGRISLLTIAILLATTALAALIGVAMARTWGLDASGLVAGSAELARADYLTQKTGTAQALTLPAMLLEILPANPFLDLTGARKTSTIAVVIFAVLLGVAAQGMEHRHRELAASFNHAVEVAHALVLRLVALVLRLTPYGIFALMAQVLANSSPAAIARLGTFVLASYSALLIMFAVHLALVAVAGLSPLRYVRKIAPVLLFAFTSRTSAGTIPLSVQAQTRRLGTPEGIANVAASFGASIGQNGCAGIYPAMLAVMIAPTVGIDPMAPAFLATLVLVVTLGSIGVAGVGGGATFAALIVLSALDLPVALAGLLISVEPLIDMGRTALNVSGSITAGTLTSRMLGQTDVAAFARLPDADLDQEKT
jgi:hypothetical protein